MSTITQTQVVEATAPIISVAQQPLKVDGTDPTYGDWRDDLVRDGFAVIKGAVPKQRVEQYADKMYSLAESL
jgi:hypothetical protein